MLYISRQVKNKYVVVDTDDNTESVVLFSELVKIVRLGVEIKGVLTGIGDNGLVYIHDINVYQPVTDMSVAQIKRKSLDGLEIIKDGDTITGIFFTGSSPVRVRLSDYGSVCGKRVFMKKKDCQPTDGLTLVLDDHIKYYRASLRGIPRNVILDITDLENKSVLKVIEEETHYWSLRLLDNIVDRSNRNGYLKALHLVIRGNEDYTNVWEEGKGKGVQWFDAVCNNPDYVKKMIDAKYMKSFLDYLRKGFTIPSGDHRNADCMRDFICVYKRSGYNFTRPDACQIYDFKPLHERFGFQLVRALHEKFGSFTDVHMLNLINNYLSWFPSSQELQDAWKSFLINTTSVVFRSDAPTRKLYVSI